MSDLKPAPILHCWFCGKLQSEVYKLIAGPTAFICDECINLCADIISENRAFDRITSSGKLLVTPAEAEKIAWMRTWTRALPPSEKGDGHG